MAKARGKRSPRGNKAQLPAQPADSKSRKRGKGRPLKEVTTEAAIEARRAAVLKLRIEGHSERYIAAQLGVSKTTVHEDIGASLVELADERLEATESWRDLHLARLERLVAAVWPKAEGGDDFAIDRVVKLLKSEARLLGLEAPKKIELGGTEVVFRVNGVEVSAGGGGDAPAEQELTPDMVQRIFKSRCAGGEVPLDIVAKLREIGLWPSASEGQPPVATPESGPDAPAPSDAAPDHGAAR